MLLLLREGLNVGHNPLLVGDSGNLFPDEFRVCRAGKLLLEGALGGQGHVLEVAAAAQQQGAGARGVDVVSTGCLTGAGTGAGADGADLWICP